jgi:hypothetical protein
MFVMKGMFLCKRGRQDIQPAIAFMATRVTEPNEGDWKKLVKMMNIIEATKNDIATMSADDSNSLNQVVCQHILCSPQGHEEPHWSHNDSWFRCYLLYFYKTKDQYPQFY